MPEFLFRDGDPDEDEYTEERDTPGEDPAEMIGSTVRQVSFDMPLDANTRNLLPPGDMHEPPPYTGELDWQDDGSELLHPFFD